VAKIFIFLMAFGAFSLVGGLVGALMVVIISPPSFRSGRPFSTWIRNGTGSNIDDRRLTGGSTGDRETDCAPASDYWELVQW